MTRRSPTTSPKPDALSAVVLAAGEGKRMKSDVAKVLHPVAGRPLVEHVVRQALAAGASPVVVVVGVQSEAVRAHLDSVFADADLRFVEQTDRRGTGDAVARARPALQGFSGDVLILCGDVPGLRARALQALASGHRRRGASLSVLSTVLDDPRGYGRVVRGDDQGIRAIVEDKDATADQAGIAEINTGTYCARWEALAEALERLRPDNAQGEYYLTDAVRLLLDAGQRVDAVVHHTPEDCQGVNSRQQLSAVGASMNRRKLEELMARGVTVVDPASTWVHDTVTVGRDVVLHPQVVLEGATRVARGSVIRSGSRLCDVAVGPEALIKDYTIAERSEIGRGAAVGPFAHLRPGTVVGAECKIGNFVETKKATFGRGAKASHLSYIGDARVGREVNIGAGTITCNYDGESKHLTELGAGVFIGSDTQLVAPVRVGKGAYVGAGTTVTKDVPDGALAITRPEQKNIEGWVARRKKKRSGTS